MSLSEKYSDKAGAEKITIGLNMAIPYNFELIDFKFYGENDGHLLACIQKGTIKEFVTWEFSIVNGKFSVFWGHYFPVFDPAELWNNYGAAYKDFNARAGIKTAINF